MRLYAITNRRLLAENESAAPAFARPSPREPAPKERDRRAALIALARHWAKHNIDYIQIREKDLAPEALLELTQAIVNTVRQQSTHTRVLLNGPAEIALAAGADGIHLPTNAPPNAAAQARNLFAQSGREATLSHACHSLNEVLKIREQSQQNPHATTNNTLILYAPVFEKIIAAQTPDQPGERLPGQGLEVLKAAAHAANNIPVYALGGITLQNAPACISAGAAGIAAIRLFIESGWQHMG